MTEILWHGRGGQGAFSAAKILGAAYSLAGKHALAFPSFGPERRGAPILAFTKLDSKPVGDRSQIKKADYVIFLDDTLFSGSAFSEIKEGGKIYINTRKPAGELIKTVSTGSADENIGNIGDIVGKVITFDADSLALEILNMPVTNTVMLSLLARDSSLVSEDKLTEAVKGYLPKKIVEKNVLLIKRIFGRTE